MKMNGSVVFDAPRIGALGHDGIGNVFVDERMGGVGHYENGLSERLV
jgi:hypothetical protein